MTGGLTVHREADRLVSILRYLVLLSVSFWRGEDGREAPYRSGGLRR